MRLAALLAVAVAAVAGFGGAACQRVEQQETTAATVDCSRIAETLASFEIGNYAPADHRAAVVTKHRRACETANVTPDEAGCLGRARDTWAARACLPKMFPAKAGGGAGGCVTVAQRMREAIMGQVGSDGSAAAAQLDKMLPIVTASCEQDSWPSSVVSCIVDAKPGDMDAFQRCSNQLSQALQEKMAQRLLAMQQQQPK